MKNNPKTNITFVLSFLIGIFVVLIAYFVTPFPNPIKQKLFPLVAFLGLAFLVLGIALIILTYKQKIKGGLKWLLLLTGFSSAGILPSVILHNIVYGLFIYLFGQDYWERIGMGDEPFFFILALIILPLLFLVGAVGSVVLLIRKR